MPYRRFLSFCSLRRTVSSSLLSKCSSQTKNRPQGSISCLVDPTRENWNCIFDEIERLSERLEQLGIDALREADDV